MVIKRLMEAMKTLNFIKDYGSASTGPSIQYLLCKNTKLPFGDGRKTVSFLKERKIEQTYFFVTLNCHEWRASPCRSTERQTIDVLLTYIPGD